MKNIVKISAKSLKTAAKIGEIKTKCLKTAPLICVFKTHQIHKNSVHDGKSVVA